MNSKDQHRRFTRALEDYSADLAAAVMDSFAARLRDQARHAPDPVTLLAVAGSAEDTATGIREEHARRRTPPPIEITIRDRDGRPT